MQQTELVDGDKVEVIHKQDKANTTYAIVPEAKQYLRTYQIIKCNELILDKLLNLLFVFRQLNSRNKGVIIRWNQKKST